MSAMGANDLQQEPPPSKEDGHGCHSGSDAMLDAAKSAGKSETLAQYAKDYPCPKARARTSSRRACARPSARCAWGCACAAPRTILSGSACCVYGLTFTSHFYGARRSVGYVPFNSETLVTGKLFEDIRESVHAQADPAAVRRHRHHQPVRAHCQRCAAAVAAEGDQRRAHHRHRRARFRRAHACRGQGRAGRRDAEATRAPRPKPARCSAPRNGVADKPTVTLLGEMFPADPVGIGMLLEPMGLAAGPVVPTREWRELYAALDCAAVAAIHPFYTASVREFETAGRPVVASAPVGHDGTEAWLQAIGSACNVGQAKIDAAKNRCLPAIQGALAATPIKGRITVSGYEGSELLVARLLIESGAEVPYVGSACPKTPLERPRPANGCRRAACTCSTAPRWSRTSRRCANSGPTWRSAPRRWCRRPSSDDPGAVLHQPDFGAAVDGRGGRRLVGPGGQRGHRQQGALRPDARVLRRRGGGDQAGVWEGVPQERPEFRADTRARSSS